MKKDGRVEELPTSQDPMVGAVEGMTYHEAKVKLEVGDSLFMFTDGITEAMNSQLEEFGDDRLVETLEGVVLKNCQEIIDAVTSDVKAFVGEAEQSDDITMLVLKHKA